MVWKGTALGLLLGAAAFGGDFTTYIGDQYVYAVNGMTADAAGNTYVTGTRTIPMFVSYPGVSTSGATDIFVVKLDITGSIVMFTTLTGKNNDVGNGIAVDGAGNIWVAGMTSSPNFPLYHPLQQNAGQGNTGFLTKLSPDGQILFSTYLGGTQGASGLNAVTTDANGDVYVTGWTNAPDYPHTAGLPAGGVTPSIGTVAAAFFAKISGAGDRIIYAGGVTATMHECGAGSSCFLSPLTAAGAGIAVDVAGNAYVAGNANGSGLPTTAGALRTDGIGAFVMKVNPGGTGLVYLTMLGSANYIPGGAAPSSNPGNWAAGIAADAAGNAYLTGWTLDPAFPATAGVVEPAYSIPPSQINPYPAPPPDAFAAKLNPQGTAMVWATFLGGTGDDRGKAIALDGAGNAWVTGTTASTSFLGGGGGEFLVEFNANGTALSYGARFAANSLAEAITFDSAGVLHLTGATGIVSTWADVKGSTPHLFGITNAAGGALDGRISAGELISIYGQHFAVSGPVGASFDSSGFLPKTLAGVSVTIGGIAAPLLYVSAGQINAVVPVGIGESGVTQVDVEMTGPAMPEFRAYADATAPQVFRNADGSAAAINQDGTLNSPAHPAPAGSIVAMWATGTGSATQIGADGQMATSANMWFCCSVVWNFNTANIQTAQVSYMGSAPGMVNGVTQINFEVVANPVGGDKLPFTLVSGTKASDATYVYVDSSP